MTSQPVHRVAASHIDNGRAVRGTLSMTSWPARTLTFTPSGILRRRSELQLWLADLVSVSGGIVSDELSIKLKTGESETFSVQPGSDLAKALHDLASPSAGRSTQPKAQLATQVQFGTDMESIATFLRGMGLRYSLDSDGDITFTMRLPGEATRQDGSPDWSRFKYSMQPDFSIIGEFTDVDITDWAKRIVRIYLIGARLGAGVLEIHAYPRIVPAKFENSAHIRVVPAHDDAELFNRTHPRGFRATHFKDESFALTVALKGSLTEESLEQAIFEAQASAASFLTDRIHGWMVTEPA